MPSPPFVLPQSYAEKTPTPGMVRFVEALEYGPHSIPKLRKAWEASPDNDDEYINDATIFRYHLDKAGLHIASDRTCYKHDPDEEL